MCEMSFKLALVSHVKVINSKLVESAPPVQVPALALRSSLLELSQDAQIDASFSA